jgi:threonine/homoserine/homoserine lactone efflux protein
VFVVLGLLVDSTIALLSGRIGTMLRTRPNASRRLNEVAGIVFIGLAARLTI